MSYVNIINVSLNSEIIYFNLIFKARRKNRKQNDSKLNEQLIK